jgi:uncharacterized membrane protein YhaH (DUF805 family)
MDTFIDLFKTGGRANRAWYLWHIILDDIAMVTAGVGLLVLAVVTGIPLLILPAIGVFVAGFWAGVCVTIKRLHDIDRPGWHWWLLLIPLYNIYLGLSLLFVKGTSGPNQFGGDPLGASALTP